MTESGAAPAAGPATLRVLIVDDDALVRSALHLMLGGDRTLEVVGEASDGARAVEAVAALRPHVVLMDIRMPVMDGIAATTRILSTPGAPDADHRSPEVIVLTTFDADELVLDAVRAGASGFLLKDTPPERILAAVHQVAAGDPILSPSVTRQLMAAAAARGPDQRERAAAAAFETLTGRERAIALAIGQGRSNAEIAQELFVSVATVKAHVTHLLARLGVENRVQVAIRVHEAGLL